MMGKYRYSIAFTLGTALVLVLLLWWAGSISG